MHCEFDKYIIKIENLEYNKMIIKLDIIEKNLSTRAKIFHEHRSKFVKNTKSKFNSQKKIN